MLEVYGFLEDLSAVVEGDIGICSEKIMPHAPGHRKMKDLS
jgi:hypothetical protein